MPREYTRIPGSRVYRNYSTEKLESALTIIRRKKMSQRSAAKYFKIPRSTLKYKLKGEHQLPFGGIKVLTDDTENAIVQHCIVMSDYGFPLDTYGLRCIVKSYIDKTGYTEPRFKQNMPGVEWTRSFLKRNNKIALRFSSNLSKAKASISPETINEFFNHISKELDSIPPSNIWNYDETNLTDDPGTKKVLCKRGCRYPERILDTSKTSTSIMYCGNAMGELLPPYVVYKAHHLWSTWTEGGPSGTRYNRSKSGWFDSVIFDDWFFQLALPKLKRQEGKKVLIGDNLSSHMSVEVIKSCNENQIAFVCLPPNSTHLTQPLDIAFYKPLKVNWRKVLTAWKLKTRSTNCSVMPKDQFPRQLKRLHEAIDENAAENLISGFRKAGIYPLNRGQVLTRLPHKRDDLELITSSFLDKLSELRTDTAKEPRRKRRRLNVTPGMSVTEERIEVGGTIDCGDNILYEVIRDQEETNVRNEEILDSDIELEEVTIAPTKHLKPRVGSHVIVEYEGELFPGRVEVLDVKGAEVNVMVRSGKYWKWPEKNDEIFVLWSEIKMTIQDPDLVTSRGMYKVPELEHRWA